jgi:RHH-type proline utilization regulon transcriptional repressor/proline dehydrogenase/delta 1-pyrroline-5-carboxylate dehydrogenase
MSQSELEDRIRACGLQFFASIGDERPSLFDKSAWSGKIMDACMQNDRFKLQLFRFIDVLPTLTTTDSFGRHLEEYFAGQDTLPAVLKWGLKGLGWGGNLAKSAVAAALRKNLEILARDFIVGATTPETIVRLQTLRAHGFAFTLDVLGEATISEREADAFAAGYQGLLDALGKAQGVWRPLEGGGEDLDWGHAPRINVSVKPSALFSLADPVDGEGSVQGMLARLKPLYRKVVALGGFLCLDTETHRLKSITFELYRRLRADPEFRAYPHLGLALQAYLRESERDADELLEWARQERLPISLRLVKGAYWDYETVLARQCGWPVPVYTIKGETDAAYERIAERILRNHDICHLACGSHNVRSVSAVLEMARALEVPAQRFEFQALYGMAEPFRKALLKTAKRVRLYCPHGQLLPGMAYLIRRLLENTANESFLRQAFVQGVERDLLLQPPQALLTHATPQAPAPTSKSRGEEPFRNEAFPDWTQAEMRQAYSRGLEDVRKDLGRTYPLSIGGREVHTEDREASVNPANPSEIIGYACQAGPSEVDQAVAAAWNAFPTWRDTPPARRAAFLVSAAAAARHRIVELAAWQTLEAGKQWTEAYLDVGEAIDFLDYYAREMLRLAAPRSLGTQPGEANEYFYEPKGVAAVIAPWNFPLAIGCGMSAAAIVAGNPVIYKPSNCTPVVGHTLAEIFREAEFPPGVFNYLPGRSRVMGDVLVEHRQISLIAFTGSMEVGLHIIETAGRTRPDQGSVKKVIAEMDGKNAVIVDDDADLDEAVPGVMRSAFGYQGQKCSACSRAIVVDAIYDRFLERLLDCARSVRIGPAEDPACFMGPLIDQSAQARVTEYIALAREEGLLAFSSAVPAGPGFYVPLTIATRVPPDHRLAQEEIFGPVLSVLRARDFEQALAWANGTRFALTGGIFSRTPSHIDRCRREFRVGNLYINRGTTGAIVGRQPFGGFRMSGVGSKAGGPDYLLQFLDARVVTENTMRRGFVPFEELCTTEAAQSPDGAPCRHERTIQSHPEPGRDL